MLFGDRLRNLREEKNITQQKLGEIIGVSARVVGYYESNDRFPKEEQILKNIADYFNVSTDYLLGKITEKWQPNLTEKDEKDIAKTMDSMLEKLDDNQGALMFDGEALDDETRELLRNSILNSLKMGKVIAKKKYTPKKYKK